MSDDKYGKKSLLAPFFGDNNPANDPKVDSVHPCVAISRQVHQCLELHDGLANFCTPKVCKLEQCLKDFDM